jgi:hypothetical protein
LLIKLGTFWRFGWRPIASYFFLFLVFFALTQLTSDERISLWGGGGYCLYLFRYPCFDYV